ncbi:alkaline phosphatase family protein [Dokdonella sp.]|uniref:alkaline phosphatase family protein n=1 Tax=Dokdonella sp. TaxID=2291710 RepID=UPI003C563E6C
MIRILLLVLFLGSCATAIAEPATNARRMIVLGVDGLDPVMLRELMNEGATPNLRRLADSGGFEALGTSIPPQSPVAWSSFITGMDPGGHGLFDFIALDRETMLPYLSAVRVESDGAKPIQFGRWQLPVGGGELKLLRDGRAFWQLLEEHGVPATIFQVPANYPPVQAGEAALSGMGTPDLRGTSGTFSYYTDDASMIAGPVSGGIIERATIKDGLLSASLTGPSNVLLADESPVRVRFTVRTDPANPVLLFSIDGQRRILQVGEWSDWIPVRFPLLPGIIEVSGMVRVYVKQIAPHFGLYISPINIDPRDPAQQISYPVNYAPELAEASGPFYTQEMPEDTKALSAQVLSTAEFLDQTELVMDERRRLLDAELERFRKNPGDRFLFFYLSTVDQRNHMLARESDSTAPDYDPDTPEVLRDAMRDTYREIDELVGSVMQGLEPGTTFAVMSDHGFAPFRRGASLNAWLEQHGYLKLLDPSRRDQLDWLEGIDWKQTRAFGLGLNALYLNVRGRERDGIVEPDARARLSREIVRRLGDWHDPENDEPVVTQAVLREDVYHGPHVEDAPDIIVGYARGYRASWDTATGKVATTLLEDNAEAWSGDHCMDSRTVPGVLLVNRPLKASGDLRDLPVTILDYFGIAPPAEMQGQALW